MASRRRGLWLCLVVFMVVVTAAEGLACYSCSGTTDNSDCQSSMTSFREAASGKGDFFLNCSAKEKFCVVEQYTLAGITEGLIRGCTDNKSYSFPLVHPYTTILPPRYEAARHNTTICYPGLYNTICVTLCTNDFCNGPNFSPVSSDQGKQLPLNFLISILLFVVISSTWAHIV